MSDESLSSSTSEAATITEKTDEAEPGAGAVVDDTVEQPPARLGYQPALDGLRGLALLAIVAFHSQVPWMPGAFLSVSTFFTLSGFLITTLVIEEVATGGRFSLRRFYARRARRLLPAALVSVALIVVAAQVLGNADQLARLRADALASLFYVANWHLIAIGDSYGAIFQTASPFTHFWTLAIEEQFYLLFPLLAAGTLVVFRRSVVKMAAAFGFVALCSVLWSAWLVRSDAGIDRVYFGTDTRMAELLVGAIAAVWWARARPLRPGVQRVLVWSGIPALVLMLWLWHVADRNTLAFYRGGLAVYALLTVVVILSGIQPNGPLRRYMGWRPLVAVGIVSYGAYLLHWPILVWLRLHAPLPPWAQLAVGLALTLAAAALLHHFVEHPIRIRRRFTGHKAPWLAGASIVAVAALILGTTISPVRSPSSIDFGAAAAQVNVTSTTVPVDGAAVGALSKMSPEELEAFGRWSREQEAVNASKAPSVAVFGDSTALMTGYGLSRWLMGHLDLLKPAGGEAQLGCGLLTGMTRYEGERPVPIPDNCTGYVDRWVAAAEKNRIDIALIQVGPWEVRDHDLGPDAPRAHLGQDAAMDVLEREALDRAITALEPKVGHIVILLSPDITVMRAAGVDPPLSDRASDPVRMERFRQIEREVAAKHGNRVSVVDLQAFLATRPDERQLRPDGVHFTEATSQEVAAWLGPAIAAAYRDREQPR